MFKSLQSFFGSTKGNISATIIGVVLASIILGSVGMPILLGVNTTGWSAQDITMYAILPTFLILSLIVAVARETGLI